MGCGHRCGHVIVPCGRPGPCIGPRGHTPHYHHRSLRRSILGPIPRTLMRGTSAPLHMTASTLWMSRPQFTVDCETGHFFAAIDHEHVTYSSSPACDSDNAISLRHVDDHDPHLCKGSSIIGHAEGQSWGRLSATLSLLCSRWGTGYLDCQPADTMTRRGSAVTLHESMTPDTRPFHTTTRTPSPSRPWSHSATTPAPAAWSLGASSQEPQGVYLRPTTCTVP